MMWIKKWWLEHRLNDGIVFKGWVCTFHDCDREAIPNTIFGRYWAYQDQEGLHGGFDLSTEWASERMDMRYVFGYFYRPVEPGGNVSREDALASQLQPVDFPVKRFEGLLQDDLVPDNTTIEPVV